MLGKLHEAVANRHRYAQEWKARTGQKVMGCFCSYVPEEILYAAGVLPVRLLGSNEPQDISESHIASMFCPFSRDLLAQGLQGKYSYLDGIVQAKSCIHLQNAFDSWRIHIPASFSYFLSMPFLVGAAELKHTRPFFLSELRDFQRNLEGWLGKAVDPDSLAWAIAVYNENRRLLHQLYDLRKSDPPLVSGAEALESVLSSMLTDKREHSQWLKAALAGLPQRTDRPMPGVRLMVVGSEWADPELFRFIEAAGANIVADEMCTGSRYFWNETPLPSPLTGEGQACPERSERGEGASHSVSSPRAEQAGQATEGLLETIATRYLARPPCPIKDMKARCRFELIWQMVQDYKVKGVVLLQQKFCDPHEFDIPPLANFLRERGIPSYFIEVDITVPKAAIRTRIEAFLETLELDLV